MQSVGGNERTRKDQGSSSRIKDVDEVATILEIPKEESKCQLLKIIRDNWQLSKMVTKVFERLLSKVLEIIPFLFFPIKIKTCCVNRYQRQHMLEGGKSSYSREVGSVCCKAVLVIVYSLLKVWFTNPLAAGSDFFQVRWGPCLSSDWKAKRKGLILIVSRRWGVRLAPLLQIEPGSTPQATTTGKIKNCLNLDGQEFQFKFYL